MPKVRVTSEEIKEIIKLRKSGDSLPEIRAKTGKGNSTIFSIIKDLKIPIKYQKLLKSKQGGSILRSQNDWKKASVNAKILIDKINSRDKFILLSALYWGEGNKKELNLNNSDPVLIKVFIECLKEIGVNKSDLKISLRLYEDINERVAMRFWSKFLGIETCDILSINRISGKKKGKLKYGMCRVRVAKSGPYFKLIMSMIDLIKSDFNAAVVQWIEQDTPNV